jgi:hypothetical protein
MGDYTKHLVDERDFIMWGAQAVAERQLMGLPVRRIADDEKIPAKFKTWQTYAAQVYFPHPTAMEGSAFGVTKGMVHDGCPGPE